MDSSSATTSSVEQKAFKKRSPVCLFLINGLGLGNSTRCHAVIEHLIESGFQIHVLTSGNGLTYFKERPGLASLTQMESFFYSGKGQAVSGWSTLANLRSLAGIARVKKAQLEALLGQIQPDVAIIDSEYTLKPLRARGIPVVALNTSEMIVTQYLAQRQRPSGTASHFWCIEFSDYLFHRYRADLILSPFPLRTPTRHPRFRRIGIIARRKVLELPRTTGDFPSPRQLKRVLFMLSGSIHASQISFAGHKLPFTVDVVGRPGDSRPGITFHGRQINNEAFLADADALVINGGYSAVSEAFVLNKPTFVVPVAGHAEQFVNACLIRDMGLGFVATESNIVDQLLRMHQQDRWIGLNPRPAAFEIGGAKEAAQIIASVVER